MRRDRPTNLGADRGTGSRVGGDEAVQRRSGEVRDLGEANAAGRAVCDFDRTGDEHFALDGFSL